MIANRNRYVLGFRFTLTAQWLCVVIGVGMHASAAKAGPAEGQVVQFGAFREALEAQDDTKALSTGDVILAQLEQKYKHHAGFMAYKSKLDAAEFLARNMQQQLKKATSARLSSVANELFDKDATAAGKSQTIVAPAKSFRETSVKLFSRPVNIDGFDAEEKSFLGQYYDLKLRILTIAIAKAGQALAVAEPGFKGTHDYVLVLPLLHVSEGASVNIRVLPQWMRRADQLDIFVDSCLLHFGLPFHAMSLARTSAQIRESPFSELDFYRAAAAKCGTSQPHIAEDCLRRAINCAVDGAPARVIALEFEVVQLWLDSGNYSLAASHAHKIFETYPNHEDAGKAIWLHYYALSRSDNISEILAGIDKALDDKRCEAYKPRLMYIKWWALRRKRDQSARVAALEYELLKQYGNDPMVAPILLSRATDCLASQNYTGAYESLNDLVQKFPSTKAAAQAEKMLAKLKDIKQVK